MELIMKLERKLEEREGEKDGRKWKAASFLASTVNTPETKYIAFDVMDSDKGRIAEVEAVCGKVCKLEFSIEANENQNGRWFNKVKLWRASAI